MQNVILDVKTGKIVGYSNGMILYGINKSGKFTPGLNYSKEVVFVPLNKSSQKKRKCRS